MRLLVPAAILATLVALAGCGGSSSSSSSASASAASTQASSQAATAPDTSATSTSSSAGATLKLTSPADGSLKFDQTQLAAKAGSVTLVYTNPSSVPHGVALETTSGAVVTGGKTSTVTVTLAPGTYTFYCPVPGHRQAGMQGTLTVS
jgi:plastocyanin